MSISKLLKWVYIIKLENFENGFMVKHHLYQREAIVWLLVLWGVNETQTSLASRQVNLMMWQCGGGGEICN
jgi:hypothetical protein